ncbi:hypothetical protein ACTHQY_09075 [Rhodococcoides corynebacterioides]|uniref:hypothetical protein n=1 Tax=Rhodococcoides corynebacterioides TaxID=53972 RepID=UPI003F814612
MTKTVHNPADRNGSLWNVDLVDGRTRLLTGHEIADLARRAPASQFVPDELWRNDGDDVEFSNYGRSSRWGLVPLAAALVAVSVIGYGLLYAWRVGVFG